MPRGLVGTETSREEVLEALRRVLENEDRVKKTVSSIKRTFTLPSNLAGRRLIVYKGHGFYLFIAEDVIDARR